MANDIFSIPVQTIDGNSSTLEPYRGQVLLIVNTASKCGFTPQYEGLEKLYRKYKDRGFSVLGFPCNQFMVQEPGDEASIQSGCLTRFAISFPMFAKVKVNGKETHPLYQYLKAEQPGTFGMQSIKWNFAKFLVDRTGKVVERIGTATKPEKLESRIEKLLEQKV